MGHTAYTPMIFTPFIFKICRVSSGPATIHGFALPKILHNNSLLLFLSSPWVFPREPTSPIDALSFLRVLNRRAIALPSDAPPLVRPALRMVLLDGYDY